MNSHDDTNEAATQLRAAAVELQRQGRTDMANTARDLADRCEQFGGFVSDRQAAFARDLVRRSQEAPRPAGAPIHGSTPPAIRLNNIGPLFVTDGLAQLCWQQWQFRVARDRTTTWVKFGGVVVGRMDQAGNVWPTRAGRECDFTPLTELNDTPEECMREHGLQSGRCSICNRELTDPESIALGIGPICFGNFRRLTVGRGAP